MIYDDDIAGALEMIQEFGQPVTWVKPSTGEPIDPDRPWLGNDDNETSEPVHIVFLPTDRDRQQLLRAMGGSEIPTGSLLGYMGAVSFTPSLNDHVLRDGQSLAINYIDTLAPNGTPILYTIGFNV